MGITRKETVIFIKTGKYWYFATKRLSVICDIQKVWCIMAHDMLYLKLFHVVLLGMHDNVKLLSKVKGKFTVLSQHPGSRLCSADFDKYLLWWLGFPVRPYPSGYPSQLPGEYTTAHTQLGATAYKSTLTGNLLLLGREARLSILCRA